MGTNGNIIHLLPSESPICRDCQIPTRVVVDTREGDYICTECGLVFKSEKYMPESFDDSTRTSLEGCSNPRICRYGRTPPDEKKRWKRRMDSIRYANEMWLPLNAALLADFYCESVLDVHTFSSRDSDVVVAACLYQV